MWLQNELNSPDFVDGGLSPQRQGAKSFTRMKSMHVPRTLVISGVAPSLEVLTTQAEGQTGM